MKTIVYAASDATFIEIDSTKFWNPPETFSQSGKSYRRLTPEYWAWFYHKYLLMEDALTQGKITEATFVGILDRIAKLYNLAFTMYGKKALDDAVRTTDVRKLDEIIKRENAVNNGSHSPTPSLVVERGR